MSRVQAAVLAAVVVAVAVLGSHVPGEAAPPLRKCKGFSGLTSYGKIRTRAVSCASARDLINEWGDTYQRRFPKQQVRVIRVGSEFEFRCLYRQHTPRNPSYNPYAVVKCKAPGGRRLSWEGYS